MLPPSPVRRWRYLAAGLILGGAALRLVFLTCACPLDLAPDEAHYWDWSRHLDWSYYSKGPLVAWLIRLSCLLFGDWSRSWTGGEMLAVRLPAVVCGSLMLAGLYALTVQVYRRERLALGVVALALTMPAILAGSTLMTIDAPFTCCWTWALVCGHHALFRRAGWAWPVTGLLLGLGILAKYTMVLWLPSLGLFLLTTPGCRQILTRPGPWITAGVAGLCCLPILAWNAQHDWVSVWHVGGQAGVRENAPGIRWLGPLAFVGTQFGVLLGVWFVIWVQAMGACGPWRETRPEVRYLWWLSAPTFAFFLLFGFKTGGGEPNWPVTCYLSGLVLAAGWLPGRLAVIAAWHRRLALGAVGLACVLGLVLQLWMCDLAGSREILAWLAGPPTEDQPLPLRRLDPTCRLRGWHVLACEVDRLRGTLEREGTEPVLAGLAWIVPGELSFYCRGQPPAYSLGVAVGDRHSQYDVWHPNPLGDAPQFAGRTFIVIGQVDAAVRAAFSHLEPTSTITYHEEGQPVAYWHITVCRGFRGFRASPGGPVRY